MLSQAKIELLEFAEWVQSNIKNHYGVELLTEPIIGKKFLIQLKMIVIEPLQQEESLAEWLIS